MFFKDVFSKVVLWVGILLVVVAVLFFVIDITSGHLATASFRTYLLQIGSGIITIVSALYFRKWLKTK